MSTSWWGPCDELFKESSNLQLKAAESTVPTIAALPRMADLDDYLTSRQGNREGLVKLLFKLKWRDISERKAMELWRKQCYNLAMLVINNGLFLVYVYGVENHLLMM